MLTDAVLNSKPQSPATEGFLDKTKSSQKQQVESLTILSKNGGMECGGATPCGLLSGRATVANVATYETHYAEFDQNHRCQDTH